VLRCLHTAPAWGTASYLTMAGAKEFGAALATPSRSDRGAAGGLFASGTSIALADALGSKIRRYLYINRNRKYVCLWVIMR
jgi:hypothetical protein